MLEIDGHYRARAPAEVGCLSSYFRRLRGDIDADAAVLAGFDFPIGVPASYADKVGVTDFVDELTTLRSRRVGRVLLSGPIAVMHLGAQTLLSSGEHGRDQEGASDQEVGLRDRRRSETAL